MGLFGLFKVVNLYIFMDSILIFSLGSNALPKEEMWPHCEDPNDASNNTGYAS